MEVDSADENSAGHPNPSGSDTRRGITTKREAREVTARPEKDLGEDDATRTPCPCHHARGTGRTPRENDEDRECRKQHIELGVDFAG